MQSLGEGERRAKPAGHRPQCAHLAPPSTRTGSPALTVLRAGNPRASIVVVPISVVAATALGHTLHLVLVEEWLAGRALRVAAWGGRRAGRRLTSRARRRVRLLHRRLCLPVPGADMGRQEPLAPSPVCCPGVTRCGLPIEACPHLPGLAGPSGKAHWGSGRSSDRARRRAGSATHTPRVGCSSRRTELSEGERGCRCLPAHPPTKEAPQAAPTGFQASFSSLPSKLAPREPSPLGAMCLSGFYTQEHAHTHVVHACPCVCTHARQAPERLQLHLLSPPGTAQLTADVRGPPGHAHARFVAGLGVGGHGRAETLTVAPRVAGAGVAHAGLVVPGGVDLGRGGGCSARGANRSPWTAGCPRASPTAV